MASRDAIKSGRLWIECNSARALKHAFRNLVSASFEILCDPVSFGCEALDRTLPGTSWSACLSCPPVLTGACGGEDDEVFSLLQSLSWRYLGGCTSCTSCTTFCRQKPPARSVFQCNSVLPPALTSQNASSLVRGCPCSSGPGIQAWHLHASDQCKERSKLPPVSGPTYRGSCAHATSWPDPKPSRCLIDSESQSGRRCSRLKETKLRGLGHWRAAAER